MEENKNGIIPLGLCKQAYMKLESAMSDIMEIKEDDDLSSEDKETFNTMGETLGLMMAHIVNIVSKEMNEEEFLNEDVGMDNIDAYPGDEPEEEPEDIMDNQID